MSKNMLSVAKPMTSQQNKKKKERQIWPAFLPKLSTMVPEKRHPTTIDKGVTAAEMRKNVIQQDYFTPRCRSQGMHYENRFSDF